jgi:hypothetical protein
MAKFNKKKKKKEETITIAKSMYDQLLFELDILHRTQFAMECVENIKAFDGEDYSHIMSKILRFCVAHAPLAEKTDKQLRVDIRNILDNCTSICYLKGDDFGAHPIQKTSKKRAVYELHKYITQGVENARRVRV